jgi:integrase
MENPTKGEAKPTVSRRSGKDSKAYWKSKLKKRGKGPEWYCRMYRPTSDGTKDVWISLGLSNQEAAAAKAAKIYRDIQILGWDHVLDSLKPKRKARKDVTIGDFLREAENALAGDVSPRTARRYLQNFRVLARDICEIKAGKKRFRKGYGSKEYRDSVDSQSLSKVNPKAIEKWKRDRLAKSGGDQIKADRIRGTINTYMLSGKALFSPKVLNRIEQIEIPAESPFEGIKLEKQNPPGYRSEVKIEVLIQQAFRELRPEWPELDERTLDAKDRRDRHEQFKCFLLMAFAGLRTGEVDLLKWDQIDFAENEIHIETNEYFRPKSVSGKRTPSGRRC